MKVVVFHPKAREAIRSFPIDARYKIGKLLYLLQRGHKLSMPQARPMPIVAPGVGELRIKGPGGSYRIFYSSRVADTIKVCHAFIKKTEKTAFLEIELGRKRLNEMQHG